MTQENAVAIRESFREKIAKHEINQNDVVGWLMFQADRNSDDEAKKCIICNNALYADEISGWSGMCARCERDHYED